MHAPSTFQKSLLPIEKLYQRFLHTQQVLEMKCPFCFIVFVAFVTAKDIRDETPSELHNEDPYATSLLCKWPKSTEQSSRT